MYVVAHVIILQAGTCGMCCKHPLNLLEGTDSAQGQVSKVWIPEEVFA